MRQYLDRYTAWDTLTLSDAIRPLLVFTLESGSSRRTYVSTPYQLPDGVYSTMEHDFIVADITFPKLNSDNERLEFSVTLEAVNSSIRSHLYNLMQDPVGPARASDAAAGLLAFWFLNRDGTPHAQADLPVGYGVLESCTVQDGADVSTATLTFATSTNTLFDSPIGGRYTHEAQKRRFPSDTGFSRVEVLQDWTGSWVKAKVVKNKGKKEAPSKRRNKTT